MAKVNEIHASIAFKSGHAYKGWFRKLAYKINQNTGELINIEWQTAPGEHKIQWMDMKSIEIITTLEVREVEVPDEEEK